MSGAQHTVWGLILSWSETPSVLEMLELETMLSMALPSVAMAVPMAWKRVSLNEDAVHKALGKVVGHIV